VRLEWVAMLGFTQGVMHPAALAGAPVQTSFAGWPQSEAGSHAAKALEPCFHTFPMWMLASSTSGD
jgi:hypothetical protein